MSYSEFEIISRYFNRQILKRCDVNIGIGDDCALVSVPTKKQLAVSTDTFVSGVHFLPSTSPEDFACKSVSSSLSDLAAMGADPTWISLSITLPYLDHIWLQSFSDSFLNKINYYGVQLIGGDTTRGPMSVTCTVYGFVPIGKALSRSGAYIDDWIYVTGTLGDSAAGLAILQNKLNVKNTFYKKKLIDRHLRPKPRILHGQILRNFASSAIDISDGLVSDLKHILNASCCGANINIDVLPKSEEFKKCCNIEQNRLWSLSGGEDYELCFTVSEINRKTLEKLLFNAGLDFTCIGQIKDKSNGIRYYCNNQEININLKGFDHFNFIF